MQGRVDIGNTQFIIPFIALNKIGAEIVARCANQSLEHPAAVKNHGEERCYGASRMVFEDTAERVKANI